MKHFRPSVQKILVLMLIVSLIPGLTAFAASGRMLLSTCVTSAIHSTSSTIPVDDCCDECCEETLYSNSASAIPAAFEDCCELQFNTSGVGAAQGAMLASYSTRSVVADDCCDEALPLGPSTRGTTMAAFFTLDDGCGEPAPVDGSCGITLPAGSVVGDMPANQQAYWAPGKESSGVTINAGTYWVTGEGKADNGDEYYRILVACQYLWVPVDTMQPSYQAPWSGQPLPTTAVT